MRYFATVVLAVLVLAVSVGATESTDTLLKLGVNRVAITTGDTIATYSALCTFATSGSSALIRAAVTDSSRRRICFQNTGNQIVSLGSSTVVASNLYVLGEATNTARLPVYCTNSSAAFYCGSSVGVSSMTVVAIEEKASNP